MKVGDKVWVETTWQQQLEGEPLIVEAQVVHLTPSLATCDWGTNWRAIFNRHAVGKKEDIIQRVRERLERESAMAHEAVQDAQDYAESREQELREFEEKYGS